MRYEDISQAHLIKTLRSEKGWTQSQLAKELGVNRSTVVRWENDLTKPNSSQQAAISKLRGKEAAFDAGLDSQNAEDAAERMPHPYFAKRLGKTLRILRFKVTGR